MGPGKLATMASIKKNLTNDKAAELLESVADRIASGDRSFEIHVDLTSVDFTLLKMKKLDGLVLTNRIAPLLHGEAKEGIRYEFVRKRIEELEPLDPAKDSEAIRALAREIRSA